MSLSAQFSMLRFPTFLFINSAKLFTEVSVPVPTLNTSPIAFGCTEERMVALTASGIKV